MPSKGTGPRSLQPDARRAYRAAAALYDFRGKLCQDCRHAPAELKHHLDEEPTNNAPENVVFLCGSCHRLRHNFAGGASGAAARDGLRKAVAAAAVKRRARTHCVQGHPLDALNTYWVPGKPGWRGCKACRRQRYLDRRSPPPLLLASPSGTFAQMRLPGFVFTQTGPRGAAR